MCVKDVQTIGTVYAVPNQTGLKHYGTGSLIRFSYESMYSYHTTVRVQFACYRFPEFIIKPLIPAQKDCLITFCAVSCPLFRIRTSRLQEKPSALKREHPALQNMKFMYFFLFLGVIFALLDRIHWPDWIRIQSGSETLIMPLSLIYSYIESIQYCYIQYVTIVEAHSSFLTAVARKNRTCACCSAGRRATFWVTSHPSIYANYASPHILSGAAPNWTELNSPTIWATKLQPNIWATQYLVWPMPHPILDR